MWVEPCIIPCVAISQLPPSSQIACVSQGITICHCYLGHRINIHELSAPRVQHHSYQIFPSTYFWKTNKAESLRHIATDDDHPVVPKPKQQPVLDIAKFGTYIAIVSHKQPTYKSDRSARLPKSYHPGIPGVLR